MSSGQAALQRALPSQAPSHFCRPSAGAPPRVRAMSSPTRCTRLAGIEADLARRRADLEALAAARAAIGRFGRQCLQPFRIGAQGDPPRSRCEWNVRGKSLSSLRRAPKHSSGRQRLTLAAANPIGGLHDRHLRHPLRDRPVQARPSSKPMPATGSRSSRPAAAIFWAISCRTRARTTSPMPSFRSTAWRPTRPIGRGCRTDKAAMDNFTFAETERFILSEERTWLRPVTAAP